MVGNKAKKAIAAALSGAMVLSAAAPALAGVWTGTKDESWYRINGDHEESYTLMFNAEYGADVEWGRFGSGEIVKGENRYDTMFDAINYGVQNDVWTPGQVKEIVVASGESQADSLVAAGLAGALYKDEVQVPVVLTEGSKLSLQAKRAITAYADALVALGNGNETKLKVHIVGGEAAVSKAVEDAILAITDDDKYDDKVEIKTDRYAGDDRSATSLAIFKGEGKFIVEEDKDNIVYVANGTAWPDSLSVSSFAYSEGRAILLTGPDGKLTADQVAYLKDNKDKIKIKVIGGPALPSVQQLFDEGFIQARVNYVGGKDRYETSAAVINDAFEGVDPEEVEFNAIAVASGSEAHWADALIGGPFVGAIGVANSDDDAPTPGVLAIADMDNFAALKAAYEAKNGDLKPSTSATTGTKWAYIIGGEASLSEKFADALNTEFPPEG